MENAASRGCTPSLDATLPPTPMQDLIAAASAEIFVWSSDYEFVASVRSAGRAHYPIRTVGNWQELKEAVAEGRAHIVLLDAENLPGSMEDCLAELARLTSILVPVVAAPHEAAESLMALLAAGKVHRLLIKPVDHGMTGLLLESAVGRYFQMRDDAGDGGIASEAPIVAEPVPVEPSPLQPAVPVECAVPVAPVPVEPLVPVRHGDSSEPGLVEDALFFATPVGLVPSRRKRRRSRRGIGWVGWSMVAAAFGIAALLVVMGPFEAGGLGLDARRTADASRTADFPIAISSANLANSSTATGSRNSAATPTDTAIATPNNTATAAAAATVTVTATATDFAPATVTEIAPGTDTATGTAPTTASTTDTGTATSTATSVVPDIITATETATANAAAERALDAQPVEPSSDALAPPPLLLGAAEEASASAFGGPARPQAVDGSATGAAAESVLQLPATGLVGGAAEVSEISSAQAHAAEPGHTEIQPAEADAPVSLTHPELARLLSLFDEHLAEGRLLELEARNDLKPGPSALSLFERALALDPHAPQLLARRAALAQALLDSARAALDQGDLPGASVRAEEAFRLGAEQDRLAALDRALKAAHEAQRERERRAEQQAAAERAAAARAAMEARERLQAEFLATPAAPGELRLIDSAPLIYPPDAQRLAIDGWVDLEFIVGTDGYPREIAVIESRPRRIFDEAAVAAVAQQRYEPFVVDGHAYARRLRMRMRFALQ